MSRSVVETVLGAFVLIGAMIFLVFSYSKGDAGTVSGYKVLANFSGIGGLKVGDEVQVSGVKIGQVSNIELDSTQYLARVTMEIDESVKLPDDTVAAISSQSLLGGKFVALEPGGSPDMLEDGGEITFTQAPQNLEDLLGKFIFSAQKGSESKAEEAPQSPAREPMATTSPSSPSIVEPEAPIEPQESAPQTE